MTRLDSVRKGPYRVVRRTHHSHTYGARGTIIYRETERYRVQFVNPNGGLPRTELLPQRFTTPEAAQAVADEHNERWAAARSQGDGV